MVKISVIIPVYNVEKYLNECLDSVVNQTLDKMEIICVNDGSKDESLKILNEYAAKDSRIRVIDKPNGGYGSACNVGLNDAKGKYIAILEPDDYIDCNMYEELYKIAEESGVDIVKSNYFENYDIPANRRINEIDFRKYDVMPDTEFNIKDFPVFLYYHPSIWSCVYSKEFIEKNHIRFVEAPGASWTDNPFQVQTMCLAEKIVYTPKAYYYWRKINLCDSDDLKDYRIPFLRSREIHDWLRGANISDDGIWACLYKREMAYIFIVLGMLTLKTYKLAKPEIERLLKEMDMERIKRCKYVTSKEIKHYKELSNRLDWVFYSRKLKYYRKKMISINWNKQSKCVVLFGKNILGGKLYD